MAEIHDGFDLKGKDIVDSVGTSVISVLIGTSMVGSAAIQASVVTSTKISPDAIYTSAIIDLAVTSAKLGASAVASAKVAPDAIYTSALQDAAVTAVKIGASAVTSTKIQAGAVTSGAIAAAAVGSTQIDAGVVTSAKLGASCVTSAKISASAVMSAHISPSTIASYHISPSAIASYHISVSAIGSQHISNSAIVPSHLDRAYANLTVTAPLSVSNALSTGAALTAARADHIHNIAASVITSAEIDSNVLSRRATLIVAASNSLNKRHADYVCDAANDEVEILSAIANLPANGGQVYLMEGSYIISSAIVMSTVAGITLTGAGKGTKINTTANISMVKVLNVNDCIIENIYCKGNDTGAVQWGIELNNADNCIVRGCWVEDCGDIGIGIGFLSNNNVVSDCHVSSCGDDGIFVNSYNNTITNNLFKSNGRDGIQLYNCTGNLVIGNTCNTNVAHGIWVYIADENIINGNYCDGNDSGDLQAYSGIQVLSSDNNTIIGNICKNNDKYEIDIADSLSDNNTVVGNQMVGTDHVGTLNDAGTGTVITGNYP